MAVFKSRGTMLVVRDVLMMFVMVGKRMSSLKTKNTKKRGGVGIDFSRLGGCIVDSF